MFPLPVLVPVSPVPAPRGLKALDYLASDDSCRRGTALPAITFHRGRLKRARESAYLRARRFRRPRAGWIALSSATAPCNLYIGSSRPLGRNEIGKCRETSLRSPRSHRTECNSGPFLLLLRVTSGKSTRDTRPYDNLHSLSPALDLPRVIEFRSTTKFHRS